MLQSAGYETIKNLFSQATGDLDLATPFHTSLLYFDNAVFLYRIIVFVSFFLTGIFLFYILSSFKYLSKNDIFFIFVLSVHKRSRKWLII